MMMATAPEYCRETHLDRAGGRRRCIRDTGHDGDHRDIRGDSWEPPRVTLDRLRTRWGHDYRIAWTGTLWVATTYSTAVRWRTEIEPTPGQLEERLHARQPVPTQRKARHVE